MAALLDLLAGFSVAGLVILVLLYFLLKRSQKSSANEVMREMGKSNPTGESGKSSVPAKPRIAELPPLPPRKEFMEISSFSPPEKKTEGIRPVAEKASEGGYLTIKDLLASPKAFEGKHVWIKGCRVTPGIQILGVFAHTIADNTGKMDGFAKELMEGEGDVGGIVRMTTSGSPYLEF